MANLTGFLFFCIIVIAVFMMHRFLRFDEKIIYPGTREELAQKEAEGQSGKRGKQP